MGEDWKEEHSRHFGKLLDGIGKDNQLEQRIRAV
jgi:hypothetical protein